MAFRILIQRRRPNRRRQDEGGDDSNSSNDDEAEERLLYNEVLYSSDDDDDSSDNNNNNNDQEEVLPVNSSSSSYDISLPAQHLYLGNLEEEGVASYQDEEATPILPLYYCNHVLFPEETLPLHIFNPHAISMLRDASTAHKPVAVCTDLRGGVYSHLSSRRPGLDELAHYGTTAEIVACREDEEGSFFHGPRFIVKFKGRQRFKLLGVTKKLNGMMDCKVEILSDILVNSRPPLLLSLPPPMACNYDGILHVARLPEATPLSVERAIKCRHLMNLPSHCMSSCSVPEWTLRQYELDHLRQEVIKAQQLNSLNLRETAGTDPLPYDITSLSYWLSRRLPVDDNTKLELLRINCPTQRLMIGLKLLKENTELYCNKCGILITQKDHMFSMSVDGPLAAYVNEGGFVHETLTVTKCINIKYSGRPTAEHSWFPGYKWTIINCKQCKDHKGWCFDASKKDMIPLRFYGLRRPGLVFSAVKKITPSSREHLSLHDDNDDT